MILLIKIGYKWVPAHINKQLHYEGWKNQSNFIIDLPDLLVCLQLLHLQPLHALHSSQVVPLVGRDHPLDHRACVVQLFHYPPGLLRHLYQVLALHLHIHLILA